MIVLKYTTKGQVIPLLIRSICKHFCAKITMGGLGGVEGGEFYRGKSLKPHNMLHKSFSYLMYFYKI